MIKILYTATVVRTHINAFHLPFIAWCKAQGWETHVAAKNDYYSESCDIPGCDRFYDIPFNRSPFSLLNIKAFRQLKHIIEENDYDIIHCNTPVAGVLTRLAARKARKKGTKVIYMVHGFHFYKGAPLKNRLLYYPVEKMLSWFTDIIITINQEDYAAAKRFAGCEVRLVPGVGVDTERFGGRQERAAVRKNLGVGGGELLLLSIGELIPRKNHESIIKLMPDMDQTVKYAICGSGELYEHLSGLIVKKGLEQRVLLLGFRRDIPEICGAADIFVFPSLQEGLPVALMEAMASGLPCAASDVRGISDLIRNGYNGFLCPADDAEAFREAVTRMCEDSDLRLRIGERARNTMKDFDISVVIPQMAEIYGSCIEDRGPRHD